MKKQLVLYILLIVTLFSACSVNRNPMETDVDRSMSANIIMNASYGQIRFFNGKYQYVVYGKNKEIVEQGESTRLPDITFVNDSLLKFSLQTGTGLSTQWGFYYDFEKGEKSAIFTCIYDNFKENVVYGDYDKIIIRNIFDVNEYYYEIPLSLLPLSDMVEPIININFVDEGKRIKVLYYSGKDFSEETKEFILP